MENTPRKGLSPNVILLSIVSFLNDLSSEMIMPILPMFLQALGGGGETIGLVGGLRDAVSNILKIFCGYWSDKTGQRKIFVYGGYFVSSIFKLLLATSKAWPSAVLYSGLERVGKGLRTAPRDAIIAESMREPPGSHKSKSGCTGTNNQEAPQRQPPRCFKSGIATRVRCLRHMEISFARAPQLPRYSIP